MRALLLVLLVVLGLPAFGQVRQPGTFDREAENDRWLAGPAPYLLSPGRGVTITVPEYAAAMLTDERVAIIAPPRAANQITVDALASGQTDLVLFSDRAATREIARFKLSSAGTMRIIRNSGHETYTCSGFGCVYRGTDGSPARGQ